METKTGLKVPLEKADRWAAKLVEILDPYCDRIEIAGSIRRRRPIVHDVDLVVLPKHGQVTALKRRCLANTLKLADGPMNLRFRLDTMLQVEVYIAADGVPDMFKSQPTNFGTLLLCRTGSKEHNIYMAARAKSMGLHWNPYWGIYRGQLNLACATEEEIFKTLNLDFIPPEKRER